MTLVTATRRGLVLTFYSEIPLVMGLLAFALLSDHQPLYLSLGIGASLVVGAGAGIGLWVGRNEFGPAHARNVRRGALAFAALGLSLLLAYTQLDAIKHTTLEVRDLWAPWTFLGIVVLADATAMWFLTAGLVVGRGRLWARALVPAGLVAAVAYFVVTQGRVAEMVERSGGVAAVPAEASSYARDFVVEVVVPFAWALLALRTAFWPTLYWAVTHVAEAEHEAAARRAQGEAWSASPPG